MTVKDLIGLISGSDVRGTAVETPGSPLTLPPQTARLWAMGYGRWLGGGGTCGAQAKPVVGVGRDMRLSSPALHAAAIEGLQAVGCRVVDLGMCTTPACFLACVHPATRLDGAIMVTASHHPFDKNGMKFFTPKGGLDKADLLVAAALAFAGGTCDGVQGLESVAFLPLYVDWMVDLVREGIGGGDKPLAGERIVVDAGNGMGGFFVEVLQRLGADTTGSICLEPDGAFPDGVHNPEQPQGIAPLCRAVRQSGASFGILFDPDCDRSAAVDGAGEPIVRNRLIALAATLVGRRPGCTIVTDSLAGAGVTEFLAARGMRHVRSKRGYRNLINDMTAINRDGGDCPLAIETSGHAAFAAHYCMDDGAYLAARLLIAIGLHKRGAGEALDGRTADLWQPPAEAEARIAITAADFGAVQKTVIAAVAVAVATQPGWRVDGENPDGVKVFTGPGERDWLIVRPSVHDPVLPVNFEASDDATLRMMVRWLDASLADLPDINAEKIRQLL